MAVKRTRLELAELVRVEAEHEVAMIGQLRGLLAGRLTREQVLAWVHELWPPGSGQGGPFRWGAAAVVFDSIYNIKQVEMVREVDLRGYLRWLSEGGWVNPDDDELVWIDCDIEEFAAQIGTEVIRWWYDGLGWAQSGRFCAPGSGRSFVVGAFLNKPGRLGVSRVPGDDLNEAAVDLFEALAIDDNDVSYLNPRIELAKLPVWALWREDDNCNRFEIARFRSYAKACAQQRVFTARGHRQTYWVDAG